MLKTPLKECKKCKVLKPTTEFYPSTMNADKLNGSCKRCVCARVNKRYHELKRKKAAGEEKERRY